MPRTSRTEAAVALRAALYERVSSEEQVEGYYLDAQDRAARLARGTPVPRPRRPEAASPLRPPLYERFSGEEQVEGYSRDAEARASRLFCDAHGWDVARVYRDEGKSARTDDLAKRPEFARM